MVTSASNKAAASLPIYLNSIYSNDLTQMVSHEVEIIQLLWDIYRECSNIYGYFDINMVPHIDEELKGKMAWLGRIVVNKSEDANVDVEMDQDDEGNTATGNMPIDVDREDENQEYIMAAARLLDPLSEKSIQR